MWIRRPLSIWRAVTEGIGHDGRYALRLLGRSPAFAAVAIGSLRSAYEGL